MKIEHKSFQLKKLNVNDSDGTFEGYASTFGNVDLTDDVIDAGAFKKTLRETKGKVPILDHHDPRKQIGWNLEAVEDERGLKVKGQLNLETQGGKEKYALMKQAAEISARASLSIGFRAVKADRDRDRPGVRRIKEVALLEYSVVTFPANPLASITGVKHCGDLHQEFLILEMGLDEEVAEDVVQYTKSLLDSEEPGNHSEDDGAEFTQTLEALKTFNASIQKNFKE